MNNEALLTKLLRQLAERDRARVSRRRTTPRNGSVPVSMPILTGASFATDEQEPFSKQWQDADNGLTFSLFEAETGELCVQVQAKDASLAGRTVDVELQGEMETLRVRVLLNPVDGDCNGRASFGPFREAAARLGKQFVLAWRSAHDGSRSPNPIRGK